MGCIKRIEIKNFRSINYLLLDGLDSDINVFVGNNDIGKSNILRALNLFFKHETDLGSAIDFWEDFNKNIRRTSGRGQYIKIVVDIKLKYEIDKYVRWTKKWDNTGKLEEDLKEVFTDDDIPSNYVESSRARGWLERITYRYVPAIKSPLYFEHLFEELHNLMSTTYASQFKQNTSALIAGIQNLTQEITEELKSVIGIENRISLPADLKAFFRALDFAFETNGQKFNLRGRGDGIKARHIPVVLKFLATNAKAYRKGALETQTVWGFEEPENNLEMLHAFDMAKKFLEYSNQIQIFLTTHSPAFYSLRENNKKVTCWFVDRDINGYTKCTRITDDTINLDEKMGMLAYVTPFIKEKEEELVKQRQENETLISELKHLKTRTEVVVLTEDEADGLVRIRTYFNANGFDINNVEFYSYRGKTNINGALLCADVLMEKHPHIKYVVIHRDRDVDGEDYELVFQKKIIGKANYYLLMPAGYDLESEYISAEHIHELYPQLSIPIIEEMIEQATEECKEKSIEKLLNSLHQLKMDKILKDGGNPRHFNAAKFYGEILNLYGSNELRYRYGKTVLGRLKAKLQEQLGHNPTLERFSSKLQNPLLAWISSQL